MATLDPGDEVIIPAPYWVSYPDLVMLPAARRSSCPATNGRVQADARVPGGAITPQDQVADPEQPVQPTGAAYSRADLRP